MDKYKQNINDTFAITIKEYMASLNSGKSIKQVEKEMARQLAEYDILSLCVLTNNEDALKSLVERGIDINSCNSAGITPLMLAVRDSRTSIVKTLFSLGVSPNICNKFGDNAIHYTNPSTNSKLEIIETLFNNGVNFGRYEAVKLNGQTYFHDSYLSRVFYEGEGYSTEEILEVLSLDIDVNEGDRYGNTPLLVESRKNKPRIALLNKLLDKGANPYWENISQCKAIDKQIVIDLVRPREEREQLEKTIETPSNNLNNVKNSSVIKL